MKRSAAIVMMGMVNVVVLLLAGMGGTVQADEKTGAALFKEHCALCHPDGGNIVNPKKTLHKKDLDANSIKSPNDIVKLMRKPGPGMTTFDPKSISDNDAKDIAEYIVRKFK